MLRKFVFNSGFYSIGGYHRADDNFSQLVMINCIQQFQPLEMFMFIHTVLQRTKHGLFVRVNAWTTTLSFHLRGMYTLHVHVNCFIPANLTHQVTSSCQRQLQAYVTFSHACWHIFQFTTENETKRFVAGHFAFWEFFRRRQQLLLDKIYHQQHDTFLLVRHELFARVCDFLCVLHLRDFLPSIWEESNSWTNEPYHTQ